MNSNLFDEALRKTKIALRTQEPSQKTAEFLKKYINNKDIFNFFLSHSYHQEIKFRYNVFYKVNDLSGENSAHPNEKCINESLLIVGHGLNGDYIVLNLTTYTMGYIFHDELWENDSVSINEIYIDMKYSIGEFYLRSLEYGFPVDGFQAEKFMV
ncbi:hypothetical protein [Paenibacillus radicis (ex Xue et al. 2023)]|uniref:SMI1/KNR4 family protein n=1 Tax=Paenibacillus radicis (ex Xue et al. 2023) TaxID=2972489 RepID=A0ABT1YFM1_9BACL|nr:hypothetical protein [Paenibacillus radicis (ex Xue et al. 2023)]MCR8631988.1 hypothetical protein [Paenibacillus radicis (ex Xue et al. 2023)]